MVAPDPKIEPYLKQSGFWHVAQMVPIFYYDRALISALVECWRPESHTFHLPYGECTITLEDVVFQLGLRVDGFPFTDTFGALPHNADEETIIRYTRAYIMILLGGVLFPDKSVKYNVTEIAGCLPLLQSWAWYKIPQLAPRHHLPLIFPLALRWMSYNNNEVRNVTPRFVYDEVDVSASVTALIQFVVIEWHHADHVVRQFGRAQHIPIIPINIDRLHAKDGRARRERRIHYPLADDDRPSVKYFLWYLSVVNRFLSLDGALQDLKLRDLPDGVTLHAPQAPEIVHPADVPDRRSFRRRLRAGTRTSRRQYPYETHDKDDHVQPNVDSTLQPQAQHSHQTKGQS
ncbi:serine/threonine-protein phosphatase 7 long form homolog [Abrus precatorius]|uniref:Serine/threonine-protein phosphatase 7 long form homolog n=1 Tax=Abrus precatorius TaxID=3816 RepID=A0A8B8M2C3_ABRPR|nr:serine/threonine-protein phosphatase 7 long form homolog [Abrus precatorius]